MPTVEVPGKGVFLITLMIWKGWEWGMRQVKDYWSCLKESLVLQQ